MNVLASRAEARRLTLVMKDRRGHRCLVTKRDFPHNIVVGYDEDTSTILECAVCGGLIGMRNSSPTLAVHEIAWRDSYRDGAQVCYGCLSPERKEEIIIE